MAIVFDDEAAAPKPKSRIVFDDAPAQAAAPQEASLLDRAIGSRTGRLGLGLASAVTGPFQLGANLGDKAADYLLGEGGFRLGDWTNEQLAKIEEMKKRGMAANGDGEFDAMGLGGAMLSGGAASKGIKMAPTMLGKMGQGGLIGGLFGLSAPVTSGDESYWGDKATQVAVGGGLGAAAPPVIAGVSKGATAIGHMADRFLPGGTRRIADRELAQHAGGDTAKQALINALSNPKEILPGSKPRASEVLADMPEGRPMIALEKKLQSMNTAPKGKNAPSVEFARRDVEQNAAREAAKTERNAITGPMREQALKLANETTQKFDDLGERIIDRYYSKAAALQTKGKIDTLGAQAESSAKNWDKTWYPQQGNTKLAGDAAKASDETAAIIAARQSELAAAEKELAALKATGAEPLKMDALQQKITRLRDKPGNFSTDVVRKTMDSIKEKISASVEKFGKLDANELYAIRKNIGKDIEAAMGAGAKPDRKFNAMLERDIQLAFDDTIEAAGGKGWKAYLAEYSKRSQAIKADVDRSKLAKDVASKVTQGAYDSLDDQAGGALPNFLNPKVALANALIRRSGGVIRPKVAAEMTSDMLDPKALAAALQRSLPSQRQKLIDDLMAKYGRGAVQNALAVELGKE